MFNINPLQKAGIFSAITAVLVVTALLMMGGINDAGYRTVIQKPNGSLTVKFEPGVYLSWFGKTTEWPDFLSYDFSNPDGKCDYERGDGVPVTYQDGGKGVVCGLTRIALPNTEEEMIAFHKTYRNEEGARTKLLNQVFPKAMNLTAALMNSEEAYATKRSEFIRMAREQTEDGVYRTKIVTRKVVVETDEKGKEETQDREVAEPIIGADGKILKEKSDLVTANVTLSQFDLKSWDFERKTLDQISENREAEMAIVTSKAKAKRAYWEQQQVIADGQKAVASEEYKEKQVAIRQIVVAERDKEKASIVAQQQVDVAKLQVEEQTQLFLAAEEEAKRIKMIGDANAHAKRVVMEADGALSQKLDAWTKAQGYYANAISKQKWVPEVQLGGEGSNGNSGNELLQMMGVQAAKQLSLEMKVK